MLITGDVRARVRETSPARHDDVALDAAVPIEAPRTGGRESSRDMQRARRHRISFLPDPIVGRQDVVDGDSVVLEGADVKGQHSRVNYPSGERVTSETAAWR